MITILTKMLNEKLIDMENMDQRSYYTYKPHENIYAYSYTKTSMKQSMNPYPNTR